MTLEKELSLHGYELEQTGGGCTAYMKNTGDAVNTCFVLTICYKNSEGEYETDSTHPEEWPVYFGLCDDDAWYVVDSTIMHNVDELIKAEKISIKNRSLLKKY